VDWIQAFVALPKGSTTGSYAAAQPTDRCRVARSYDGYPALLVELSTQNGAKIPRRLANFAYRPPSNVQIRSGSKQESAQLAIVECCTYERRLTKYFFRIAHEILRPEAETGDEVRFEAAIDAVITLFQAIQRAPTRTIQGLWAELAVIAFASKSHVALSSWHSSTHALHDFSNGASRLEVKSSTKELREHTFLLDQLFSGDGHTVVIASLLLRATAGGRSVFDLVEMIRDKLDTAEQGRRLETIVADALGNSFDAVEDHRYDLDSARVSLQLYRAEDVPRVAPPPVEVKDVSFTADLSTTKPISAAEACAIATEIRDLLPP
jgi:hypothetical protein